MVSLNGVRFALVKKSACCVQDVLSLWPRSIPALIAHRIHGWLAPSTTPVTCFIDLMLPLIEGHDLFALTAMLFHANETTNHKVPV